MPVPAVFLAAVPAVLAKFSGILGILFAVAAFKVALKLLAIFGVGTLTMTGFDSFFDIIQNQILESMAGLPQNMIAILFKAKVDVAISIILSAYVQAVALRGVDSFTRPIMVNANG